MVSLTSRVAVADCTGFGGGLSQYGKSLDRLCWPEYCKTGWGKEFSVWTGWGFLGSPSSDVRAFNIICLPSRLGVWLVVWSLTIRDQHCPTQGRVEVLDILINLWSISVVQDVVGWRGLMVSHSGMIDVSSILLCLPSSSVDSVGWVFLEWLSGWGVFEDTTR